MTIPTTSEPLSGTVCFHLAERKNHEDYPFAFLATYASRDSEDSPLLHVPLGRLLQESTTQDKKALLLKILVPLQKAAEKSTFLADLIQHHEIFQPAAWKPSQAYSFLKDIPFFEEAGITVRTPNWWAAQAPRPKVAVKIDSKSESLAGLDGLLDFNMHIALPDGSELSPQEIDTMLASQERLIRIRGQWIEVDNTKLQQVLDYWHKQRKHGMSLAEALRMFAGVHQSESGATSETVAEWSQVIEGGRLEQILQFMRNPELCGTTTIHTILAERLQATLRPYQFQGVSWLWMLYKMQLGGCLADDMGLGKTMQILSQLLLTQKEYPANKHLLILPASLLGNWVGEIKRFAPHIRYLILHSSETQIDSISTPDLTNIELVITTYGLVTKLPFLQAIDWDMIIIDEAQAIKNPSAKQTRAVKSLRGRVKFAITGTPLENSLLDLWSLFDFIAPGLLGSSKKFATSISRSADEESKKKTYTALQKLVSPYILRRLKSDKRIINDLPDKTELLAYCTLTPQQAALYQRSVDELTSLLESDIDGISRRGLVLSYLMRLKQICNHPNQWLGHNQYPANASGKLMRLQELCSLIAEKNERVLVFTQFREIIPVLSEHLATIFGKQGLELHGETPIKKRASIVTEFQKENGPPFLVLSLKAGGTGLNLTHASHVIHFDRWWNPAVENQATDRAYRIGQKRNVLVHKFVCRGTIEEKIDAIIMRKRSLVDNIISSEREVVLSELSNAELLNVISLDLDRALGNNESNKE